MGKIVMVMMLFVGVLNATPYDTCKDLIALANTGVASYARSSRNGNHEQAIVEIKESIRLFSLTRKLCGEEYHITESIDMNIKGLLTAIWQQEMFIEIKR